MNLTKKQINLIVEKTRKELKGTQTHIGTTLGYYQKNGANWSVIAGWTNNGDLVATVFGEVQ